MKTILVTGCAGFIGSNFCEMYAKEFNIIGLDSMVRGSHPKNISPLIDFCLGDVSSEEFIKTIFSKSPEISGIINFAAESHVDHSLKDDKPFWHSNVMGTRVLALAAAKKKIRLLQVSTDEIYGHSVDNRSFLENDAYKPGNPYSASKVAAEVLLQSYGNSFALNYVITRGCNTMGPRQSPDKVVPKAIESFLYEKPFPLYKTSARRLWLDVRDHCRAIHNVFLKGHSGEIYNVAPTLSNEMTTQILVEKIRAFLGQGEISLVTDRRGYDLCYRIDASKINRELSWQAITPINKLIEDTVHWYIEHPDWLKTYASREII